VTRLLALALLLVCAYASARLTSAIVRASRVPGNPWLPGVVFSLLFVAVLQGAFHLLGFIELALGRAVVTVGHALVIAALAAIGIEVASRRSRAQRVAATAEAPWAQFWRGAFATFRAGGIVSYLLLLCMAGLAAMTAMQYPREFEVNAYHLPVGLHIFQEQTFRPWDDTPFHVTPATGSLFFGLMLQLLPERLASATNLFFLAALCLAAYGLARSLGAQRRPSAIAVAGLATVPMIGFSALVLGSDVGGVAFLAAALCFAVARPFAPRTNWLLAGMAIGLAYGFKMYHAPSVAYLFVLAAVLGAEGPEKQSAGIRPRFDAVIWLTIGSMLTAGFWFARSYYYFGNPTYPLALPLAGNMFGWLGAPDATSDPAASAGVWVRSAAEWFAYPWIEWHRDALGYTISAGVGPFVAAVLPALLVIGGLMLFKLKNGRRELGLLWLGMPLVLIGWWFSAQQPRYAIGALVYAIPLVACMIGWMRGAARQITEWVLGIAVAISLGILVSKEGVEFGDHIVLAKQFARAEYFEYPAVLDTLPAGSRIAHIGYRSGHFQLFGPKHQYRVMSYPEVMRRLRLPGPDPANPNILWPYLVPPVIEIPAQFVREAGLTHIYVAANTELRTDPCVSLRELGALHRNPYNNHPLPAPRRLFEVTLCK